MPADGVIQLVIDQMNEVQTEQPDLELVLGHNSKLIVRGDVRFSIDHHGRTYEDTYQIEITILPDYPASVPTAKEIGGAVPADFHHFPITGNLCLAAPVELVRVFAQDCTLRHYINCLLIPYLFSYTFFREHGELPHGELSHGLIGLIEYYSEFFAVRPLLAMKFLKLLADNFAPPLMVCPCESGRKLRDCHGSKIDELRPLLPPEYFERELRKMITEIQAADIKLPVCDVMPKRMLHNFRRKHSRKARKR